MTAPFNTFADKIAAARDENSRRSLLAEIGGWRAGRLVDMNAQRHASWALSTLYAQLGDHVQAANEAQQLLALCEMPPRAVKGELRFAHDHSRRLARNNKKAAQGPRKPAADWSQAVALLRAGDMDGARRAVPTRKGPRPAVFRLLVDLAQAMSAEDSADREQGVFSLIERQLARYEEASTAATPAGPADSEIPGALAAVLGRPVPSRRDDLVQALDAFLTEHPDRVDEVAAAALEHHVAVQGLKAPAPWLVGVVGRALAASEGTATTDALNRLSKQGAFSVTAYSESGFERSVQALRGALAADYDLTSLRRGVMRKGEPADRRLWTVRLTKDFVERMLVVAPAGVAPYSPSVAQRLVQRTRELSTRVVVWAEGQPALAEAATAAGVGLVTDGSVAAVLAALADAQELALLERAPREPRTKTKAAAAPKTPNADAEPRGPSPIAALRALFEGETAPTAEDYAPVMAQLRRAFRGFDAVRDAVATGDRAATDARLAVFLNALHTSAPEGITLAEGTTLTLRFAAALPDGDVAALLKNEATAARFGGVGASGAVEVVRAAQAVGFDLDRVYRGTSRIERRNNPALDAFGQDLGGFWRLVLRHTDGRRAEVWWLSELTPEGLGALPQLLLAVKPDQLVVADGLSVAATDPAPLVWTDGADQTLSSALSALSA